LSLDTIKHGESVLNLLLGPQVYISFDKINSALHISRRTFFYTLKKLNLYLVDRNLDPIQNMKGVGYYLPVETKKELLQESLNESSSASEFLNLHASITVAAVFFQVELVAATFV